MKQYIRLEQSLSECGGQVYALRRHIIDLSSIPEEETERALASKLLRDKFAWTGNTFTGISSAIEDDVKDLYNIWEYSCSKRSWVSINEVPDDEFLKNILGRNSQVSG